MPSNNEVICAQKDVIADRGDLEGAVAAETAALNELGIRFTAAQIQPVGSMSAVRFQVFTKKGAVPEGLPPAYTRYQIGGSIGISSDSGDSAGYFKSSQLKS